MIEGSATPAPPRWSRLGPERRRHDIIAIANDHFARQPFDSVSTVQIAAEAGVNRGLIYHYFGTKRDLYLEVLRSSMQLPQLPELTFGRAGRPLEVALEQDIDRWLTKVATSRDAFVASMGTVGGYGRDPEVEAIVREARERSAEEFVGWIFGGGDESRPALVAAAVALANYCQATIDQWLNDRLTKDQVRVLLVLATMGLVENVDAFVDARPLSY